MDWIPTLEGHSGPAYEGIVDALGADIASGRLHRGQRLPTHRALAQALGLDLTTVTRAYNEARRRGLTEARVGQGTFVAESVARAPRSTASGIEFDLSMNLPPEPIEADLEGRLARGLTALRQDFVGFAQSELQSRREVGLPPFARLVRIVLRDQDQDALQDAALKTWKGDPANVAAAQAALHHRAQANSLAVQGKYSTETESASP